MDFTWIPGDAVTAVDDIDGGPLPPSPMDVLTTAWPHLYAYALRDAADRLPDSPCGRAAAEQLRVWADEVKSA